MTYSEAFTTPMATFSAATSARDWASFFYYEKFDYILCTLPKIWNFYNIFRMLEFQENILAYVSIK